MPVSLRDCLDGTRSPRRRSASRRRLVWVAAVAAATILAWLGLVAMRPPNRRDPASIFNRDINRVLRRHESLLLRYRDRPDRREALRGELQSLVARGGDTLVENAVNRLIDGNRRERRRAMLLLTQAPPLAAPRLARLEEAGELSARIYAHLVRHGYDDRRPARPSRAGRIPEPAELQSALQDTAPALQEGLTLSDEERAGRKPDFLAAYDREFTAILKALPAHIGPDAARAADVTGDTIAELIVIGDQLWDPGWQHELDFIALLQRTAPGSAWRLRSLVRVLSDERFAAPMAADFDDDGIPEFAVRSARFGASGSGTGTLRLYGKRRLAEPATLESREPAFRVVLYETAAPQPDLWITTEPYHPNAMSAHAAEQAGMLGWYCRAHRYRGGRFREFAELILPLGVRN